VNLTLETLKFAHGSHFTREEELSKEISFISNFSKYQKLLADPKLSPYLQQSQVTDFKPKLTALLRSEDFLDKIRT